MVCFLHAIKMQNLICLASCAKNINPEHKSEFVLKGFSFAEGYPSAPPLSTRGLSRSKFLFFPKLWHEHRARVGIILSLFVAQLSAPPLSTRWCCHSNVLRFTLDTNIEQDTVLFRAISISRNLCDQYEHWAREGIDAPSIFLPIHHSAPTLSTGGLGDGGFFTFRVGFHLLHWARGAQSLRVNLKNALKIKHTFSIGWKHCSRIYYIRERKSQRCRQANNELTIKRPASDRGASEENLAIFFAVEGREYAADGIKTSWEPSKTTYFA